MKTIDDEESVKVGWHMKRVEGERLMTRLNALTVEGRRRGRPR